MFATLIWLATGAQARWIGCVPAPTQRIYVANHTSNLDGPVIWAALPPDLRCRTRPIAARDYWLGGPLRRYLARDVLNAVLIERKRVTHENNPLRDMEAAIDEGSSLILFPEGRRQEDEDAGLNPFKPGIWHLAKRRPAVEIIPTWLAHLNRILPRGEFLPVPMMASVTFGAPLHLEADEEKSVFLARVQREVAALEDAS
jgi:1-acyl-sn-glycerol-3-phosphate acyltransferase